MKRVAFKTFGCRLNQAETAQIAAGFEAAGYEVVPGGQPSDVCVIHTCAITGRAEHTCLLFARALRRKPNPPVVVLAGCAVDIAGDALKERCGADLTAGRDAKFDIPGMLRERGQVSDQHPASGIRHPVSGLLSPATYHLSPVPCPLPPAPCLLPRFDTIRALVKVQDGCDFRCAYCIVPLARGGPRSRPFREVVDEVRRIAEAGYREIVLTGANLGCYQDGRLRLVDLIAAIERIPAVERIRLSSIESSTTEHAVLDYMATSAKLCRYLHLPLQTGDDALLRDMGRRYTSRQYRDLVERAVERIPLLGLGTDVLVGLPGETDAAFANTWSIVTDLPFSNLHIFPYSKRPGTRAAGMAGQVSPATKKERCVRLAALGRDKRARFAAQFVGRTVSVLVERVTAHGIGSGWTGERIEARMQRPGLAANTVVSVLPSRAEDDVLYGWQEPIACVPRNRTCAQGETSVPFALD